MRSPVRRHHELPQHLQWQSDLPVARVFQHDLRQDHARQVFPRARVHHLHIDPFPDHARDVLELHIPARGRVIKPPVAVFPDDNIGLVHVLAIQRIISDFP